MDSMKVLRVQVLDRKLNITFDEKLNDYEKFSEEEFLISQETLENGYTVFMWQTPS